jgi:3-hydroxyacyl-CoA dehydrogenase/3-hydroxy-2-methylbutyryl-CoA dehydrogenase
VEFAASRAIVTGGASGLGEGLVRSLVAAGAQALIVDLASSRGAELAADLGPTVAFRAADVANSDDVAEAIDAAVEHMGSINLAVNCAGVSPAHRIVGRDGTLHPLDTFRRTVEINLIGVFDVVRRSAAAMAANQPDANGERGVIVNVASIAAVEGQKGQAAYSASKGGVLALTLPLARDLADLGIRVMTICPGIMDTGMLAGIDETRRAALLNLHVFPKRLGTPTDFARLVQAICETELLNGEVIRLDAATRL